MTQLLQRLAARPATHFVALTAACLLAGTAPAHAAMPGDATHLLPAAAESTCALPWWAAYGESALDQLMGTGRTSTGAAAQAERVQAYVLMRVQQVRLGLATQLLQALHTERELLRGQSPTREVAQAVAVVDQRITFAEGLVANFTQLRDAAAGQLVHMAAQDEAVVRSALQHALSQSGLPEFHASVPERLPASVLLTREDVASLRREAAALGRGDMALNGWIAPASGAPAAPPLTPDLAARSADQTLQQAGHEVSWSLRQLAEARAAASADAQRLEARRLEVMAAQQRADLGDVGPADVLEVYLRFLGDADRAAQSQGVLALAWAALHRQAPGTYELLASARR